MLGLVDALDVEYVRDGIRTNAILPSVIDTPANRASMPDADPGDWVTPEQIAATIAFLVSPGVGRDERRARPGLRARMSEACA